MTEQVALFVVQNPVRAVAIVVGAIVLLSVVRVLIELVWLFLTDGEY